MATSHQQPPSSVVRVWVVSMTITWVLAAARAATIAARSSARLAACTASAPRLRACRAKSIAALRPAAQAQSSQHVVEAGAAAGQLQALDAAEAAVVQHHDDELESQHDRGGDLGIQHQVGAVAHHHDHLVLRARHLHAQAAGDLVAHAGIAVFDVVVARANRRATACAARPAGAGGAHHHVGRRCRAPSRARRRSRRRRRATRRLAAGPVVSCVHAAQPVAGAPARRLGSRRHRPASRANVGVSSGQRDAASATRPCAPALAASNASTLMPRTGLREQAVRAGGEILQRVPTAMTRSASRARALAAGEPVTPIAPRFSGWSQRRLLLPACVSTTGMPCCSQSCARASQAWLYSTPPPAMISGLAAPRSRPRHPAARDIGGGRRMRSGAGCRKVAGAVEGLRLHVLRQRQADRAAGGRVGHHGNRAWQRAGSARGG
jgi:hypothetical protein